jgi:hypothetical protein
MNRDSAAPTVTRHTGALTAGGEAR